MPEGVGEFLEMPAITGILPDRLSHPSSPVMVAEKGEKEKIFYKGHL